MNFTNVVKALEFVIEHKHEIASDAECCIHLIRRIEHACVKHSTTADHVLVAADKMLTHIASTTAQPEQETPDA